MTNVRQGQSMSADDWEPGQKVAKILFVNFRKLFCSHIIFINFRSDVDSSIIFIKMQKIQNYNKKSYPQFVFSE